MTKHTVAIIGTGNMGGAFASALSSVPELEVSIYNRTKEKALKLSEGKNLKVLSSMAEAKGSDVVIIAVKPQTLPSVYEELASLGAGLYLSLAAGVTLAKLQKNLKTEKVVRFMPNVAAKIGSSVTAVAFPASTKEEEKELAMLIAEAVGSAFELEEKFFAAFIGISGSGIAYMFDFMHQMAMGGVRAGIPYQKALSIVTDTLFSAASLQKSTGEGAIELETMVCSPKGTTIEGIRALNDGAFGSAVINAVTAAAERSEELEKNS